MRVHAFQNVQHKSSEGYVLNGDYYPIMDYSTTASTINIPAYFVEHFDENVLYDKINEVYGKTVEDFENMVVDLGENAKNIVDGLSDSIKNSVNKFIENPVDSFIGNNFGLYFSCPINIIIINGEGQMIGYNIDGEFVNEIDGAYYYFNEDNDSIYFLPSGSYITIIDGEDIGTYGCQYMLYSDKLTSKIFVHKT